MMFGLEYLVLSQLEAQRAKRKLIYIAGPYSHKSKKVSNARERALTLYAAKLITQGLHVWSPITESHQYSKVLGLKGSWDFWSEHDLLMLSKCDELRVLMLDGWDISVGVTAEIAEAKRLGIPIQYIEVEE